ncbi:hypothetical protein [Novosphingobium silvae]|jgi:hypothetical protein|nr:hypothetical protein [Novosphingobium silvae]
MYTKHQPLSTLHIALPLAGPLSAFVMMLTVIAAVAPAMMA